MDIREQIDTILQEVVMLMETEGKYYCGLGRKYTDQILNLPVGEEKICPICHGFGHRHSDTEDCFNCGGTGKQPAKKVGEILDEYLSAH